MPKNKIVLSTEHYLTGVNPYLYLLFMYLVQDKSTRVFVDPQRETFHVLALGNFSVGSVENALDAKTQSILPTSVWYTYNRFL